MIDLEHMTETGPQLTLDPFAGEPAPVVEKEEETWTDQVLTAEERQMIDQFAGQIDLKNSALVLQYGAGAQKKMADFSETALEKVKTKDLGEVGKLLGNLTTELKSFDTEEDGKLFGFFKKNANKLTTWKSKYAKVESNVDDICKVLEKHQVQLLKDVALLDKMYDLNLTYFKETTMYLLAGKKKLFETQQKELPEAIAKANASGLPEDAQAARDLKEACERFEKKLYDLELTRTIAMQTAPQIRLIQNSDSTMAEKIQSTMVHTIPLWKNQMILALGMEHSSQAAQAQRQVTDLTNELLRKNADKLKTSTIEIEKEMQRGIVDVETLKHTNAALISTIDEVMQIQEDGRMKRQAAEEELRQMEGQLRQKLLEIKH